MKAGIKTGIGTRTGIRAGTGARFEQWTAQTGREPQTGTSKAGTSEAGTYTSQAGTCTFQLGQLLHGGRHVEIEKWLEYFVAQIVLAELQ